MATYKTYLFKNKDPVIDVLRTCVQTFAGMYGITFGQALQRIANDSNVKYSTLYGWFSGDTISPRYCCVAAVVVAMGQNIGIGVRKLSTNGMRRKMRNVVPFKKAA